MNSTIHTVWDGHKVHVDRGALVARNIVLSAKHYLSNVVWDDGNPPNIKSATITDVPDNMNGWLPEDIAIALGAALVVI